MQRFRWPHFQLQNRYLDSSELDEEVYTYNFLHLQSINYFLHDNY